MSKIPVPFDFIPKYFRKKGILDPRNKETYKNRLAYLYWSLSKCFTVSTIQKGVAYEPFAFSCSYDDASQESGLTVGELRAQEKFFLSQGFLTKSPNQIKNRENCFKWDLTKCICGKVVVLDESQALQSEATTNQNEAELEAENDAQQQANLREKIGQEQQAKIDQTNNLGNDPNNKPNAKTTNQTTNQKQADLREKKPEKNKPNNKPNNSFLRNDIETVDSSSLYSDNEYKSRARDLSLSFKGKITDFFIPSRYRLRDGSALSLRTQNAFAKYQGEQKEKLLANIRYYEEYCDSGKPIKTTHEKFLQYCINQNLALKRENCGRNHLIAQVMKEEYNLRGMEILKTVIKLKKEGLEEPISISKELPPQTFDKVLDNYINYYQEQLRYAT